MALYTGVGGKARKIKSLYVGVNGQARQVKKAYVGVNGQARLFYSKDSGSLPPSGDLEQLYNSLYLDKIQERFLFLTEQIMKKYLSKSKTQIYLRHELFSYLITFDDLTHYVEDILYFLMLHFDIALYPFEGSFHLLFSTNEN